VTIEPTIHPFLSGALALADASPKPRCGQRWQLGDDGPIAHLVDALPDVGQPSVFLARVSGELRRMSRFHFGVPWVGRTPWRFLDGPKHEETTGEAIERVLRLEAANVPVGVTAAEWFRWVLAAREALVVERPIEPVDALRRCITGLRGLL
jgi:hypothetical protein